MLYLNNDPVDTLAFVNGNAFEIFERAFKKRQQEYSYIAYGGPYIKWSREDVIDDYLLERVLRYLHDLGCQKVTLTLFEPYGMSVNLPMGLSIGTISYHRGCNWIQKGFSITADETICRDYTVYKYVLEGVYGT